MEYAWHSIVNTVMFLLLFFHLAIITQAGSDRNVHEETLELCNNQPRAGLNKDGYCKVSKSSPVQLPMCVIASDDFMVFTKSKGHDLTAFDEERELPGNKHF